MNQGISGDLSLPAKPGTDLPRGWLEGGVAILGPDGTVREANAALVNWLGKPAVELAGQPFRDLLLACHSEWREPLGAFGASPETFNRILLQTTGATPWQWFTLEGARSEAGWFVRLNSTLPPLKHLAEGAWDEQLRTEQSRREMFIRLIRAEARLHNLVHHWPGIIFSQRADFSFSFASPKIEELTGIPIKEWNSHSGRFWDVVHESDAAELQQQIKRCAQSLEGVTTTYRIRHLQTGRVVYILEHRQAVVTENGLLLGYEGVWLDVTRQTTAEKRLSTASWKEALGMLTMGLAHDFSNIMAGIHSLSDAYVAELEPQHPFCEGLKLIKDNAQRASQLVRRIINLHHGKIGERNYQDLNRIVADVADLARKVIPRRISVELELHPDSLPLYVDEVEFRQVIINLAINAADAMTEGGRLLFRTSLHQTIPPQAHAQGALPSLPTVCLTVRDTGHGIKAKHLASIFDPFFTTKSMNKGSGLGLYNARLFTEKHRGAISVETLEGTGTAFHLWLPQSDFTEAERELTTAVVRRHSLLLVGRTERLVENTAEFLRVNGYYVVTALAHEKAVEALDSAAHNFAGLMVLLEDTDPRLNSLVKQVRDRRLPVKTILQVVSCNQDELETRFLAKADLVISPDMSEDDILDRLSSTFAASPSPGL